MCMIFPYGFEKKFIYAIINEFFSKKWNNHTYVLNRCNANWIENAIELETVQSHIIQWKCTKRRMKERVRVSAKDENLTKVKILSKKAKQTNKHTNGIP